MSLADFSACAGIVSYNPDIPRIIENVDAINNQVDCVYIFDNGSKNYHDLKSALESFRGVKLIPYDSNMGIAYALNRLCQAALRDGFTQIVTLDQDSVATPGMVRVLMGHVDDSVGIVAPQIIDRNKESITDIERCLDHKVVRVTEAARKGVITSGCLLNLDAYSCVGGFDERFFIDYVDYDLNKRLLIEGYEILRVGDAALIHECGNYAPTWLWTLRKGQDGKWCFERFYAFGHSSFRCYFKSRNRILYTKKYKEIGAIRGFEGSRQIVPQMILTLLFEKEKKNKLLEFLRGIKDGRRSHIEPYKPNYGRDEQ